MSDSTDIIIPDLGDFSDVEVIEILVADGDTVEKEDGLITLETDKATLDVPSPADGVVESLSVKVGDRVSSGDSIGKLKGGDASSDGDGKDSPDAADDSDDGDDGDDRDEESNTKADDKSATDGEPDAGDTDEGAGAEEEVKVPDIGDFDDVDVIEVLIAEGDEVALEDPLITLETDKATMDVPSSVVGVVKSVKVAAGDKVSQGTVVAVIEGKAGRDEPKQKKKADKQKSADKKPAETTKKSDESTKAASTQTPKKAELPPIDEAGFSKAHASPSVRKLARELGVDLPRVKGSGEKSRILHDDVKGFVKRILSGQGGAAGGASLPRVPSVDFAKFGEIDSQPLSRIQKIAGPRLQASWINLPHVTQHDLADITELEDRRQKLKGAAKEKGISLTPLAFIMKACISALKEFPKANASLSGDGTSLVYKQYYHLGFAADTDQGLVVPVIRDADKMDVYELAEQLGTLSKAARDGKLKSNQMQGASFTVSSLGGIGGTAFTPIVNAPEVAILGVSKSTMQPVWDGEAFKPRLMLPLSLSYDHRVVDGAYAVRFTTFLAEALGDVDALLEAIP